MSLAEVVTLYETNAKNVPDMLRALAEAIEAGNYGEVPHVTCVMHSFATPEDGLVTTFGWGEWANAGNSHLLMGKAMRDLEEAMV